MRTQFTGKRLKKFISYYKPHRRIFAMDMTFAAVSAVAVLLFSAGLRGNHRTGDGRMERGDGPDAGMVYAVAGWTCRAADGQQCDLCLLWPCDGAKMEETMRDELFAHYEKLSFGFHAKHDDALSQSVLSNDLSA